MSRSEKVEMTVLCLIYDGDKILLQNRLKQDWRGFTLPGGHVEKEESFVQAVIREMEEETGLIIEQPHLCGIKQFQTDEDVRYVVLLFKTNNFTGELKSSDEGEMIWVERNKLSELSLVGDFMKLLEVFDTTEYSEFFYERNYTNKDNDWDVNLY